MWLMTEQKNVVENSFWLVLEHKALRAVLAPTCVGGVFFTQPSCSRAVCRVE